MKEVVIIGGGVSGLTAAYRMKRDFGLDVTVLEAEGRPGGKAQTYRSDGFTCEEATNGWLDKEPAMRELISSLGLEERVLPSDDVARHRFIYRAGRLRELEMNPLRFLLSSALPLGARLRLMMEPFIARRADGADETLADFAARRLGKGARDYLIGPMAFGVYAGNPNRMSLKSCFGKVHALEQNHGGLIKGMIALKKAEKKAGRDGGAVQAGPAGRLTSLKGGIGELSDALAAYLSENLRTDAPVTAVRRLPNGHFQVEINNAELIETIALVSAAPAHAATSYLKPLDMDAAAALGEIPYPALHVVCLGFRQDQVVHDLRGFGFLMPRGQGKRMLGALFTSSIFPGRAPEGHVVIRAMLGGMLLPEVADWDQDQAADIVLTELKDILGLGQGVAPVWRKVFTHHRAIPQYHVGHSLLRARIEAAEYRHPGFFAAGNAIRGIALIDCVRESMPLARCVAAYVDGRRR